VGSTTPADGRFKIQVPALTWTVDVTTDVGGLASATVDVLTGESRHVDFVLPSGALVVHATGPHGEPAGRALLRLERPADPPPDPGADPNDAWEGLAQRFAEDDGVAHFAQIAAGAYRVRVGVGGDWVGGDPVTAQVADGSVDVTIVLQESAVTYAFVEHALPLLEKDGIDARVYYVASAELYDALPLEQQRRILPEAHAAEAMGITGFTLPTMFRWIRSDRGRQHTLHPFAKGHFLGSGAGPMVLAEAGLDGVSQAAAVRRYLDARAV